MSLTTKKIILGFLIFLGAAAAFSDDQTAKYGPLAKLGSACASDFSCGAGLKCMQIPALLSKLEKFCTLDDSSRRDLEIFMVRGGAIPEKFQRTKGWVPQGNPYYEEARLSGRAIIIGSGQSAAAIAGAGTEDGFIFGPNGEVGLYQSACAGLNVDASVSFYITAGSYRSFDKVCGKSFVKSTGAGLPIVKALSGSVSAAVAEVWDYSDESSQFVPTLGGGLASKDDKLLQSYEALVGAQITLAGGVSVSPSPVSISRMFCQTAVLQIAPTIDMCGAQYFQKSLNVTPASESDCAKAGMKYFARGNVCIPSTSAAAPGAPGTPGVSSVNPDSESECAAAGRKWHARAKVCGNSDTAESCAAQNKVLSPQGYCVSDCSVKFPATTQYEAAKSELFKNGGCWSCPIHYLRTLNPDAASAAACIIHAHEVYAKATPTVKAWGLFKTTCPSFQFADGFSGQCYACPSDYNRSTFPVTHARACSRVILEKTEPAIYRGALD